MRRGIIWQSVVLAAVLGLVVAYLAFGQMPAPGRGGGSGGPGGSGTVNTGTVGDYGYYSGATTLDAAGILSRDGTSRRNVFASSDLQFSTGNPLLAPTAALITIAGNVDAGTHDYCSTCVLGTGRETLCSALSNVVTTDGTHGQVNVASIPACPTGATNKKLYRTFANCGVNCEFLLATIASSATTYTDNLPDSSLTTAPPFQDTSTGGIYWGTALIGRLSNKITFGPLPAPVPADFAESDNVVLTEFDQTITDDPSNPSWFAPNPFLINNTWTLNSVNGQFVTAIDLFDTLSGASTGHNFWGYASDRSLASGATANQYSGFVSRDRTFGTATAKYGFEAGDIFLSGANVPTHAGFHVQTMSGAHFPAGVTFGNLYGLKIDDITGGASTVTGDKWAIKTGLGKVQFGDDLLLDGKAFASLGTPANGTQQYCNNCTVTSGSDNTCATGGTGALALRLNGAWKCEQ